MPDQQDVPEGDEAYLERERGEQRVFDSNLLQERLERLRPRKPLIFAGSDSVSDAMRAMQRERRGFVLITTDGTDKSSLTGIFTERDVLYRIVDRGRNPQGLPLQDVMTTEPEALPVEASVAWVLNKMAVGGFRHVPVVDEMNRPAFVISVRDVVDFLVEFFPSDVLNLPPEYRTPRSTKREGG